MQKKIVKNLLLMVVMAMLCFAVCMTASAEYVEYTEGYYTYTVTDGEATIVDVDEAISGDVIIPETLGGYPVNRIDYFAFMPSEDMDKVYIHSNICFIGHDNFYDNYVDEFIVSEDNKYYTSVNGVLYNKDMTVLVAYPSGREKIDFIVPSTVKSIEHHGCFGKFGRVSFEEGSEIEYILSGFSFAYIDEFVVPKSVTLDLPVVYCDSFVYGLTFEERTKEETFTHHMICNSQNALKKVELPKFFNKIDKQAFLCSNCYAEYSSLETIIIYNPKCDIYDAADTIVEGATIYGYANSTAQAYAEKYDRKFVALECEHAEYKYKYIDADGCSAACEYYECTTCGHIKNKKEYTDTAKHSYEAVATLPTCATQGYTTYICTCGDSYATDYVDMLEHKDDNGDYKCDYGCGYEYEITAPDIPDEPTEPEVPDEDEKNFFEKIIEWLKNLFDKLFGWLKK